MISDWGLQYTIGKIFLRAIKYCPCVLQKKPCFEKDMNIQSFGITIIPILGLPLGSPRKKCHLDVALAKSHRIYYREGSGASSQRLWVV
jgi:hypothetical protein